VASVCQLKGKKYPKTPRFGYVKHSLTADVEIKIQKHAIEVEKIKGLVAVETEAQMPKA